MKKAIFTLTIGEMYETAFNNMSRSSWQKYCDKFGYELVVINQHLDGSERAMKRSPAWQKLLILSLNGSSDYDRIVWVDSDIIMNSTYAYDVLEGVPEEKVGAAEEYSTPTREIFQIGLKRLYDEWDRRGVRYLSNLTPQDYYKNRGFPGVTFDKVVQTGVLACSPKHHRQLFEKTYLSYEDTRGGEWNYEMPALSYELINSDSVHWISQRFNYCVSHLISSLYPTSNDLTIKQDLRNIYDLSIFMHFAGCTSVMTDMKGIAF
jgi:hypothetical protein